MDSQKKVCTKCLSTKPLKEFYSKGNRTDSKCKLCVLADKKAKYLSTESKASIMQLKRFIGVMSDIESKRLRLLEGKLDQAIERLSKINPKKCRE